MQVDSNLPWPSQSDAKRCGQSSPKGQNAGRWTRLASMSGLGHQPCFFTLTIPNEVLVKSPQIRRNSLWISGQEIKLLRSATIAERSYLLPEASAMIAERSSLITEASSLGAEASAIIAERSSLLPEASAMNAERSSLVAEASATNDEASAIRHEGSWMIPARSPGSQEASALGRRRSNRRFNQRWAGTSTNR